MSGNIKPHDWYRIFSHDKRFRYRGFEENDFFNIDPFLLFVYIPQF